jgi:hypothetical protein
MIKSKVAIDPSQNQGVESYVYSTKIARKTNVGEARASVRLLIHSLLIRPLNKQSLEAKRERVAAKRLKELQEQQQEPINIDDKEAETTAVTVFPKVQRTKDAKRVIAYCKAFNEFNRDIAALENKSSPDEFRRNRKELEEEMRSTKSKQSGIELNKTKDRLKQAISKEKRTVYAAEIPTEGMYLTPSVGGRVLLSSLLKGPHEVAVDTEIQTRKIELEMQLDKMAWKDKIALLKKDEIKRLSEQSKAIKQDGSAMCWSDIRDIVPASEAEVLLSLIPELAAWLADKRSKS